MLINTKKKNTGETNGWSKSTALSSSTRGNKMMRCACKMDGSAWALGARPGMGPGRGAELLAGKSINMKCKAVLREFE